MRDADVPIPVLVFDHRVDRAARIATELEALGYEAWRCSAASEFCRRAAAGPGVALVALEDAREGGWQPLHFLGRGLERRVPVVVYSEGAPEPFDAEVLEDWPVRTLHFAAGGDSRAELEQGLAAVLSCANRRVLLLDRDEALTTEWHRELLTHGVDVLCASRVEQVLGYFEGGRLSAAPDALIVRDVPSIVGSGSVPNAWRRLARRTRCIVVADEHDGERRRDWLVGGAAAYLAEPIEPAALFVALGLRGPQAEVPVGAARAEAEPAGVGWLQIDQGGRVRDWNQPAADWFGARGVSPEGSSWWEVLCEPGEREAARAWTVQAALARAEDAGVPAGHGMGPWWVEGADRGARASLRFDLWPIHAGWVVVAMGDGRRAALARGAGTADATGRPPAANAELLTVLDHSVEASDFVSRIAPKDGAAFEAARLSAEAGEPVQIAHRMLRPDRTELWCQSRLFPLSGSGATGASRAGHTVAVLTRCEQPARTGATTGALRLSEVLTRAPAVWFAVDASGRFSLHRGPEAARGDVSMEPAAGSAVLGSVFEDFGDVPELVEHVRQALSGRPRDLSLALGGRSLEVHLTPWRDAAGQLAGAGGIAIDVTDRVRAQAQLQVVVEATSATVGQDFFRNLVRTLTRALGVRLAYIAAGTEPDGSVGARLRMLSLWSGSEYSEGYDYGVHSTPDETVLADGRAHFPEGIHQRFGENPWVREQGVQSYLGVAIADSEGRRIGVLGVMHAAPLDERVQAESVLRVFAARAGVEIERLRREDAIRESEARWRSLVQNAPDVIATLDREGRILFTNRRDGDRRAETVRELLGDADAQEMLAAVAGVLDRGKPVSLELASHVPGRGRRWFACRIGPLGPADGEGDVDHAILIATDVTARKEAERRLDDRVRLEQLVTEVSTRFIDMEIADVDEGLVRALGEIGDACGLDRAFVFQCEEDAREFVRSHSWCADGVEPFPKSIREDRSLGLGWIVPRIRAGRDVYVRSVEALGPEFRHERDQLTELGSRSFGCVPMTAGGRLRGFFGFDRTRSELDWDAEQSALMRIVADVIANTLERKHSEESRTELEQQLRQSQKLEAIGTLAGGFAHDFNNILMGVRGQAELLRSRHPDDEHVRRASSVLDTAAERASRLTRKILGIARGGERVQEPVNVHSLVLEVCELLDHTIPKDIAVERRLEAELPSLVGDGGSLQQVIVNLAVNARDAMPSGGTLCFETRNAAIDEESSRSFPELEAGVHVRLDVVDTGEGMDAETQQRIFEPFFSTKQPGRGTGLGLWSVYGIVREHGGALRVESELGQGTRFTIWLPVSEAPEVSVGTRAPDPPVRGKGTVLIVDDEPIVRQTASEFVRSLGYRALLASNGAEAVEVFGELSEEIDVVLLDLIMPEMDGRACFQALRKIDARVPIVLSSGYGYEEAMEDFPEGGLAGLLTKPYPSLAEFSRVLAESIAKREVEEDERDLLVPERRVGDRRPRTESV